MCSARTDFPLVFSELLPLQPEGKLARLYAEERGWMQEPQEGSGELGRARREGQELERGHGGL